MNIDKICAEIECAFQMSIAVHKTFHEKITKIMLQNHWNSTTFCEKTGLSNKVHSDMKKLDYTPIMSTVISLCIGLELNKTIAENLLKSAGLAFDPTDCIHQAYLHFVNHSKEFDIEICNQVLKKLGANKKQLLGSKSDDERDWPHISKGVRLFCVQKNIDNFRSYKTRLFYGIFKNSHW